MSTDASAKFQRSESGNSIIQSTNQRYFIFSNLSLLLLSLFMFMWKNGDNCCKNYQKLYNSTKLGSSSKLDDGSYIHKLAIIADLDIHNRGLDNKGAVWYSYMKYGSLKIESDIGTASISWNNLIVLNSSLSLGGRSMELSDLAVFNGNLFSVDDRTGFVYKIEYDQAFPWVYLSDGAGNETKGFKGEWMTVKDGELWVGGLGKEWTTVNGDLVNENPMWVKKVMVDGCVEHMNWSDYYRKLRSTVGIDYPGYMIHESCQWSDFHLRWFFLPRRASHHRYTEVEDEMRGANYLLIANEDFSNIEYRQIGELIDSRGFSAFQFVPNTNDRFIVALKSEEKNGEPVATYITLFEVDSGRILISDERIDNKHKYEGIAFI